MVHVIPSEFLIMPDDDFNVVARQIKAGHSDRIPFHTPPRDRPWTEEKTRRVRWSVAYPYLMTQMLLFEDRFVDTGVLGNTHILQRIFDTCDLDLKLGYNNRWLGTESFAAEFRLSFVNAYNRGDIKYAKTLDTADPG